VAVIVVMSMHTMKLGSGDGRVGGDGFPASDSGGR